MTYNKFEQKEEKRNRRIEMDRQRHQQGVVRRQTTAKIKDFDWGEKNLGIRRVDTVIFKAAARAFNHIILVRETNEKSLQYIGNKNMYPKPMDCKAKTADKNVHLFIGSKYIFSKTAGLVVDPTVVGADAFKDSKYNEVMKAWKAFLKDKSPDEIKAGVFRRRGTAGCYAVDLNTDSDYYGCLMISQFDDVANRIFEGKTTAAEAGMQYIHGDYDLYALLSVDDINEPTVTKWIYGAENFCSKSFDAIQDFINRGIGSPMIQHGDQFRFKHQDDTLYAFYPTGDAYTIREACDESQSIQEIFEIVYGVKADKLG